MTPKLIAVITRYSAPLALAACAALPAAAQEPTRNFKVFGGAGYVAPLDDTTLPGIASTVEASNELGWEIGGEWRVAERLGLELSYLNAQHDVEADGTVIGNIDLRPWNFTVNFLVLDRDRFSWYAGPTASYIDWSSIDLVGGGSLDVDGETALGLSTGFDIHVGEALAVQLGLRWLDAGVESPALPDDVGVDPLFMRLGVAFRF